MRELFSRRYDLSPEVLFDFLQQALASMPTVSATALSDSGDRIEFTTTFTLTSWGEKMVAQVDEEGDGAVVRVSGEPRVGMLSTPWGEEVHAATIEAQLFTALDPLIVLARSNPIVMLQADHRRVEALFARIQATDDGERAELVGQLRSALRAHMELEEHHVYPLLQDEVDGDLAEEAEVEHQLARDGLDQLQELTPDEPGFDAALVMVMSAIEHHVMEEETEAFPRLAQQLGPDRLAQMAEDLTAAREAILERLHAEHRGERAAAEGAHQPRPPRPKRERSRERAPRARRAKVDPDKTTREDLVKRARKAGVTGYSHMTKAELARELSRRAS